MDRDEALKLLRGGEDGVKEWNRRRKKGEAIPILSGADGQSLQAIADGLVSLVRQSRAELRQSQGTSSHLCDRRRVPSNGSSPHIPDLFRVSKTAHTVHRLSVVPDDKVMNPPLMNVNEGRLGRVFGQIV